MPCSPSKPNAEPEDKPFTFRWKKFRGKQWVDEQHVCAIFREGVYLECRGPLWFTYDRWRERMGPLVYTGLRLGKYEFRNLSSREPLRVGLKVSASFSFNPVGVARGIAGALVTLTDDAICGVVEGEIVRWLRPQIAQYTNIEIRRGDMYETVNQTVFARLNQEADLPRLGISVRKVQIDEPLLPDEVETGFVQAARRGIDVQSVQGWENQEFARHLAVILAAKPIGEQYLNAADIFTALRELPAPARETKVIDTTRDFPPVAPPTPPPVAPPSSAAGPQPAQGNSPNHPPDDDSFFS